MLDLYFELLPKLAVVMVMNHHHMNIMTHTCLAKMRTIIIYMVLSDKTADL